MQQSKIDDKVGTIRDELNKIADRVRQEREDTTVRVYKYKEENGYFSVSLNPVEKHRS